jgi:hypothetical protein
MPSYSIDLRDPQTILRILVCLVRQNEGELQFKAEDYDGLEHGIVLTVDYEKRKGLLCLRATKDFGGAVVVAPESHAWAKPAETAPLERSRADAAVAASRRKVPTDEDMARLEEDAMRVQELARADAEGKTPLRIRTV